MKTQLMILMFVVSGLLSSCVEKPPLPPPGPSYEPNTHVVKPGETLYQIGQQFSINYKELAQWNNIPPPYNLKAGQILVLSPLNQSKVGEIVTSQQNPGGISSCGKQVTIINPTSFFHPCPPSTHQCTGVHYDIANASATIKSVTIQYRQLGQIKVLNQNVQIPAKSVIDSRAYEVADKIDEQNIFITCN